MRPDRTSGVREMSEHRSTALEDRAPDGASRSSGSTPGLAYILAGLMAGAGAIHFAMAPAHAGEDLIETLGFAAAAWFQFAIAGLILARRTSRNLYSVAVIGNLLLIGLWAWSRLVGLPVGAHAGEADAVGGVDLLTVTLQAGAIVVALVCLTAPRSFRISPTVAAIGAMAVLGAATAAVVSDEAAEHAHGGDSEHAAGGHDDAGHEADMAAIDDARCDTEVNVASYYEETDLLGVDTYAGGDMTHEHGSLIDDVISTNPLVGNGTPELDRVISLSAQASGEAAAGMAVGELSQLDDQEYDAWLHWLAGTLGGHGDHGGEGGEEHAHLGPQPWVAMLDQEQCDQLAEEIELAQSVADDNLTAQDAMDNGYTMVTTYVPGIAAHYMNFSYVDGTFEIDKPEMLLYDGHGPDANVVGLSHYIIHEGDEQPTQGYTGQNDHYHRHIGLCMSDGLVIGDSTTSEEECEAMGGRKADGSAGWMSHAWVVPGCESPWGLFSAVNPMLDTELSGSSGQDGGNCAGSAASDRYDLSPGEPGDAPAVDDDSLAEEARGD